LPYWKLQKSTRELFLKYNEFDSNSKEYVDFSEQLRKIRKSLNEKNDSQLPSENIQEVTIAILHNLVKLNTIEKRKASEIENGYTWNNIKCMDCGALHKIKVHAVKRRVTYRSRLFGIESYYRRYMKRWLNK